MAALNQHRTVTSRNRHALPEGSGSPPPAARARALLTERLRERMPEIEVAALARLHGVSVAPERPDADYAEGLRAAVSGALAYLLAGVEHDEELSPQLPPAVLIQSRLAARSRVGLDTVLRRCIAGYALFGDFLVEELERGGPAAPQLSRSLLRTQAALLDHLVAAVAEEYSREDEQLRARHRQRRGKLIERLLAGELLDDSELAYQLDAHHLALIAKGPGAAAALRALATALDRRLLLAERDSQTVWAWLGGRRPPALEKLLGWARSESSPEVRLALGEPGEGLHGWRLSHRQAAAALPIALRGSDRVVRYAEVALLATIFRDDLLTTSLRELYLVPLEHERDGGETLRETLRAYFAADRNVSSAAARIGVRRQTVASRLCAIEARLGCTLAARSSELQTALRLHDLDCVSAANRTT